jgi:hypothetical protein
VNLLRPWHTLGDFLIQTESNTRPECEGEHRTALCFEIVQKLKPKTKSNADV